MFVDKAEVRIKAGDGGAGIVSFRHEKYVDKGGPDGGDGGVGGDVVFLGASNQHTLATFRYKKLLSASSGSSGGKRKRRGKSGETLIVPVPVGTSVIDTGTDELLADIVADGQEVVIAKGGSGGFGNAHFTSSTRQAPRIAEKGEPGEERVLTLELKMIADVGIIGLPNAGKSTFLSVVSNARPEIADYPFTTLQPNLGVVDIDETSSLLFADIPGLIEGASEGKGLGDEFLRHVERTSVLLHLIDVYQEDVSAAYHTIMEELVAYKVDLTKKPHIIAFTKVEQVDDEIVTDQTKQLKKALTAPLSIHAISASAGSGLRPLLHDIQQLVIAERAAQIDESSEAPDVPVITLPVTDKAWQAKKDDGIYYVSGKKIERFAKKTDFDNESAVNRLRDIMKKMGINHELARLGIRPGDKIVIKGSPSLQY